MKIIQLSAVLRHLKIQYMRLFVIIFAILSIVTYFFYHYDFTEIISIQDYIIFNSSAHKQLKDGWFTPEKDANGTFIWSDGEKSSLKIRIANIKDRTVELRCVPLLEDRLQQISIYWNDEHIADLNLDRNLAKVSGYRFTIPTKYQVLGENGIIFKYAYSMSPKFMGISEDRRNLGVRFYTFDLDTSLNRSSISRKIVFFFSQRQIIIRNFFNSYYQKLRTNECQYFGFNTYKITQLFQSVNKSTIAAPQIFFCTLILGFILRLFHTEKSILYQFQLSTVGLWFTIILWGNNTYLFFFWFMMTFIIMHFFTNTVRVIFLCAAYILHIYYFRSKIGNAWDSLILAFPLQLQFMRSIDIVTAEVDMNRPFFIRLLNFTSYLGTPVNVNHWYYVRYKDWISHLERFKGIPSIRNHYSHLLKRVGWIIIWLIAWYLWEPFLQLFTTHISQDRVVISILVVIFGLLVVWPLMNHFLFLGANWINTPGIELCKTPILTTSPIDYWRRQQLGIATFFREKVYNQTWGGETPSRYRNLFYIFLLVGLWHSLTYQWVIWGLLWGIIMVINRFYRQNFKQSVLRIFCHVPWLYSIICWIITLLILAILGAIVDRDPILPDFITMNFS